MAAVDETLAFAGPLLSRIARAHGWIESGRGACLVMTGTGSAGPADERQVAAALREGWLAPVRTQAGVVTFRLTGAGRRKAFRAGDRTDGKAILETKLVAVMNGEPVYAEVNVAESPLAWLRSRAGGEYLSAEEFDAGERLREDFSRAQLSPRVTVDWSRPFGTGGGNGAEEVSGAALSARTRVARALSSVGPGLSDVLISVCCFLHGLEDSEKRLAWPRRSAKLVLKFALQRLAAHYRLGADAGA